MNDNDFDKALAEALGAQPGLEEATILHAQAATDSTRPLVTISGTYTPYGTRFRKGETAIEILSRAGEPEAHSALVSAINSAITSGKGFVKSAMAADFNLIEIGPKTLESGIDGEDLRTSLVAVCVWNFV